MSWTPFAASDRAVRPPYIHWGMRLTKDLPWQDAVTLQMAPPPVITPETMTPRALAFERLQAKLDAIAPDNLLATMYGATRDELEDVDTLVMPKDMTNPGFARYWTGTGRDGWLPGYVDLPAVRPGTVIVGVIDIDIAFGHSRFRTRDGQSRILASWQQGATWSDLTYQAHLPFGREMLNSEINTLLARHSTGGDLRAALDQDGFNRAAELVSYARIAGPKGLSRSRAHGTHVMGLAGGASPHLDPEFGEDVKFLVVNLPSPLTYADGGAMLDGYLSYAYNWIDAMYRKIIERAGLTEEAAPLVTNISFGKQAGSKAESFGFAETLAAYTTPRACGRRNTVVLPAGNDNLTQSHAYVTLAPAGEPGDQHDLSWRIVPADESSNFLELWADPLDIPGDQMPFGLEVVPPTATPRGHQRPNAGDISTLTGTIGTIYSEEVTRQTGQSAARSFMYQVCLAADDYSSPEGHGPVTGPWTVRLKNALPQPVSVRVMVQTDQATLPGEQINHRSYLEDPRYIEREDSGRVADTYTYDADPKDLDGAAPVCRKGSLNSYAINEGTIVIGGYRPTDGRPAPYSASGTGAQPYGPAIRSAPSVALPSDDGYAHFGVLSDGAADGSVVAMQGTSFACAHATRRIVDSWREDLRQGRAPNPNPQQVLETSAMANEAAQAQRYFAAEAVKVGQGRLDISDWLSRQRITPA